MTEPVKTTSVPNTSKADQTRKRIPLGSRNVLTAPKKSGFVRRFVNDDPDRIQAFKDAGYSVVTENATPIGDDKIDRVVRPGSVVNPSVGGGQRAVLMEIPEKYYGEDQKTKQDKILQAENEMRRNNLTRPGADGLTGQVTIS